VLKKEAMKEGQASLVMDQNSKILMLFALVFGTVWCSCMKKKNSLQQFVVLFEVFIFIFQVFEYVHILRY